MKWQCITSRNICSAFHAGIPCPIPPAWNAYLDPSQDFYVGNTIYLSCLPGYVLEGTTDQTELEFSCGDDIPHCISMTKIVLVLMYSHKSLRDLLDAIFFAVIKLKFKQRGLSIEKFVPKMQLEWQIVKTLIRLPL